MLYPSFDEIRQLRDTVMAVRADTRKPLLPICCDILADMETPVSAYCKTAQGPYSFLLESVVGGERIARYSFLGIDPYLVMTHRGETATLRRIRNMHKSLNTSSTGSLEDHHSLEEIPCHDPLNFIQAELSQYRWLAPIGIAHDELPRFHGGAVGYLAYEVVARFERLPVPQKDELGLPLAVFCFTETVLVFDHLKHRVRIVTHLHLDTPDLNAEYKRVLAIIEDVQQRLHQSPYLPQEPAIRYDPVTLQINSNRSHGEFESMVCKAQEYICAGDIFQVVLSQRLSRHVNAAPFTVYRALRSINPSPYMFFLDLQDFHIIG